MSKNQTNVLKCTIKGVALYPTKKDGVLTYAIRISKEDSEKLNKVSMTKVGHLLSYGTDEETGEPLLNVKTKYDVVVYDGQTGEKLENVRINHGAEVLAAITVKEWSYMNKTGAHAFLSGVILLKNGPEVEPETNYKSIMGNQL